MPMMLPCRGCLGPLEVRPSLRGSWWTALGLAGQGAGLCARCWSGLAALSEDRCEVCALVHPWGGPCPEPVAWASGDAFWEYHAGRPALGALLVPAIKRGELGWKAALLERLARVELPAFAREAHLVTSAPTARLRRWSRGFDLAEEAATLLARRLGKPMVPLLSKPMFARAQAGLTEGQRRRMAASVSLARKQRLAGETILLVDDVWTTGTTLLRCAQALRRGGAGEVMVLTLFRASRNLAR